MISQDSLKSVLNDRRQLSRLITLVESNSAGSSDIFDAMYPAVGTAIRIGITGPPGAGKSSLANQISQIYRDRGAKVAIIAIDPTSPFTGGALLGDRIRMNEIGNDEKIFIRSMATRGDLGGLSHKANDVADVFDAAGYDIIIFETVGVGQSELDIVKVADSVIVVLVPESGDSIQAMKAGLMEIADIFIINKSDRPGAEQAISAVKTILMMRDHNESTWMPPVLQTVATEARGILEVADALTIHQSFLSGSGKLNEIRRQKYIRRVNEIARERIFSELSAKGDLILNGVITDEIKISPYAMADELIRSYRTKLHNDGSLS